MSKDAEWVNKNNETLYLPFYPVWRSDCKEGWEEFLTIPNI
jgi:hypothetical protein